MKAFRTQPEGAPPSVYAHYLYDADGQRVKKLVRKSLGRHEVTVYIDGAFEHHRLVEGTTTRENDTLHIMDDETRIATVGVGDPFPDDTTPSVKYHLGDHLGSSNVVIGATGDLINREEYTSYGETGFGSFARKRYRFTGKERDEESGFSYHEARYYAPWLGRWTSPDPSGILDDANLYAYVASNPNVYMDTSGLNRGKAIGWVTKRMGSKLVKVRAIFTQKDAAKLFAKGHDVLLRGAKRQHLKSVGSKVISKQNMLNHAGHPLDKELFKKVGYDVARYLRQGGKRGLPHVQDARIKGRHIFAGSIAAILTAKSADASAFNNDAVDVTDAYTNPHSGKSIAHALTFSHWFGEDSIASYFDYINPGELIAFGGDVGRAIDREREKEYLGLFVTIKKDGQPLSTYSFDKEGTLLSVGRWEGGRLTSVVGGEEFLRSLDNPEGYRTFIQELEQVVIKDSESSKMPQWGDVDIYPKGHGFQTR